ncbi:thiol-disulfide oxidoreductase ResA [Desulfosporosinus acididurans]|uniref:Thiol-disulfide oxidoreductase ResA n=1 Tax=Desulfosporosinus acididurans TaxID=476652 RepID=A0A0J1FP77_9FIRM|nr:TlpA disulfide reductase family protein [Desulfosporosinus acididurans]KLU65300.1 thiol-disulfide oxidoreductase ResA [Desulfosporosinus acididurans]
MKKITIISLLLIVCLSLAGCGLYNDKSVNGNSTIKGEVTQKGNFADLKVMPQFKVKDINDHEVTNDIFKDKKLTMINIWGTFCSPCIDEMPALQELYSKYKAQGFNLVGVVSDGEMDEVQALQILKKLKIDYVNLIPNKKLSSDFVGKTMIVPVSVFVNSQGEILETVAGSKSKEDYQKIIETELQQVR